MMDFKLLEKFFGIKDLSILEKYVDKTMTGKEFNALFSEQQVFLFMELKNLYHYSHKIRLGEEIHCSKPFGNISNVHPSNIFSLRLNFMRYPLLGYNIHYARVLDDSQVYIGRNLNVRTNKIIVEDRYFPPEHCVNKLDFGTFRTYYSEYPTKAVESLYLWLNKNRRINWTEETINEIIENSPEHCVGIPDEIWTKEIAYNLVKKHPGSCSDIPDKFWSEEIAMYVIKKSYCIRNVPKHIWTEQMGMYVIENSVDHCDCVPQRVWTIKMGLRLIEKSPEYSKHIPDAIWTQEMGLRLIENSPKYSKHIPDTIWTQEMIIRIIKKLCELL